MTDNADPSYRVFVSYIDKSREYYAAQGYPVPYRWAYNEDAPFTPLPQPLAESRLGLVTTALADPVGSEEDHIESTYAAALDPPPRALFTATRSWDKHATHTDDLDTYFPVNRLNELVAAGRVGSVAARFYGIPIDYSQRRTRQLDAPQLLEYMRHDAVDVALLVPL